MEPGAELLTSGLYNTSNEERLYITGTGQILGRPHAWEPRCDEGCVIHNPSNHNLRHMRTHWRADRGMMERICEHGVGHPDPDHLKWVEATKGKEAAQTEGVHGCDGCCGVS